MKSDAGYEYETVGKCPRTGRPIVAPKAWTVQRDRPYYATCSCCKTRR